MGSPMDSDTILEVRSLRTVFSGKGGFFRPREAPVRAVDGVSVSLRRGEIFGIVGESGCGKSTLGRTILGVVREAEGEIRLDGNLVSGLVSREARRVRRDIQYVYQDAAASLDPWWSIGRTLAEPLIVHGMKDRADERIDWILTTVGLDPEMRKRYPHELSGGQLRRVALARILILSPRIVILDEPTSGLDVSVQATVLKLLRELQARMGLTYIFISHDLSVVRLMCDRVAIMYLGKVVEQADTKRLFTKPSHPYTRVLLAAAPKLKLGQPSEETVPGSEPPNPAAIPSGCSFRTRCKYATDRCAQDTPELRAIEGTHAVACHYWRTDTLEVQT